MKTYLTWKAVCPKCKTEITQEDCNCINCASDKYYMKRIEVMDENTYAFECPKCLDNHHQGRCPKCDVIYINSVKVKDPKRMLYQIGIVTIIIAMLGIMIWIF